MLFAIDLRALERVDQSHDSAGLARAGLCKKESRAVLRVAKLLDEARLVPLQHRQGSHVLGNNVAASLVDAIVFADQGFTLWRGLLC